MDTDADTVPAYMRRRRHQLRLSQEKAAGAAGISRRVWSEIELGQRRGSDESLARIERALDVPAGSLIALGAPPPKDEELASIRRELVKMIRQLTTRGELEGALVDVSKRRLAALQARIEQFEDTADDPSTEDHRHTG
jgi:transcriptional regulator with XRE-family HTH domain